MTHKTKTFTFRVDKDTKAYLKSEEFHRFHNSVTDFLKPEFKRILIGDVVQFDSERYLLRQFLPNTMFIDDIKMDQKVSIKIEPDLKNKLDIAFETNPNIPFFMPTLSKFCQWSVIHHVAELTKLKWPKPKVIGPPYRIEAGESLLSILMIYTRNKDDNSLMIPMIRQQFDHLKSPYQIMSIFHHLDAELNTMCHGLKLNQHPTDNWYLNFQLKKNQDLLLYSFDLAPYWNGTK